MRQRKMVIGKAVEKDKLQYGMFVSINQNYQIDVFHNYFLNIPNILKQDILEYFEYSINRLFDALNTSRLDGNDIMNSFEYFDIEVDRLADSIPSYISEYIGVIGQLFLAGYLDFCITDNVNSQCNLSSNLSYYNDDKYMSWVYFRNNYFYKEAFNRFDYEDIVLCSEQTYKNNTCFDKINNKQNEIIKDSRIYGKTLWITPQFWSYCNICVIITDKGKKYYENTLLPNIYNKYKDLSVEIDNNYNIIRWIGHMNKS